MGKMLAFGIRYPSEKVPTHILLEYLLDISLAGYYRPKMGIVTANGSKYEFGIAHPGRTFLKEERWVAPGITDLPDLPDTTQEVLKFLNKFKDLHNCFSDFFGEVLVDYVQDKEERQGYLSRFGFENNLSIIERVLIRSIRQYTFFLIVAPDPCFFLKDWWPADLPNYSSANTAEHNWDRLVNVVQSVVRQFGVADLEQTSLSFEGSGPSKESDWLIEHANRIPKLVVDYA